MDGRPPRGRVAITARQREVARLVASGYTNERIAEMLGISLSGAKYHVSELLGRLDLRDREEIARWYREQRRADLRGLMASMGLARWWIGVASASIAAMACLAVAFAIARTGAPENEPSATVLEESSSYRTYSARELRDHGMVDLGRLFASDAPVEAQPRVDMVAVRLTRGTSIDASGDTGGWDLWGCCTRHIGLRGDRHLPRSAGLSSVAYFVDLYDAGSINLVRGQGSAKIVLLESDRGSAEVGVRVDRSQGAGLRLKAVVDEAGHLWVGDDVSARDPVDMITRERLELSAAERLAPVGVPHDRAHDWATWCESGQRCYVRYDGRGLLAPIPGELSCSGGVLELRGSGLTLRFERGISCPQQLPARAAAGDVLVEHDRRVTARIWAEDSGGSPVALAIGRDGRLYAGDIFPVLGCPCVPYN